MNWYKCIQSHTSNGEDCATWKLPQQSECKYVMINRIKSLETQLCKINDRRKQKQKKSNKLSFLKIFMFCKRKLRKYCHKKCAKK